MMDLHRLLRSLTLLILILEAYFGTVLARHHKIRHQKSRHSRRQLEQYEPVSYISNNNEPESGDWSPWSHPTLCTKTCGVGVSSQMRHCRTGICTGPTKRYFTCNHHVCPPDTIDFRAQQCSQYDRQLFDDKYYYEWIPYTQGSKKCELTCMPKGERFYYKFNNTVIDGTQCYDEKNDICVDGECQPVGCDLLLGSHKEEDRCRECGGDNSACNTVTGHVSYDNLVQGYNDVLLIPKGATNILIKELDKSNNYLAIRNLTGDYYLNGNFKIDYPRDFRFAGAIFHYENKPITYFSPESIRCLGPTSESIYVVVLFMEKGKGLDYEYSIPAYINSTGSDKYIWVPDNFNECSAPCGGGTHSRIVQCQRKSDGYVVGESLCDPSLKPESSETCNEGACTPKWNVGEWSKCSKICSGGMQTRKVDCQQLSHNADPILIHDSICEKNDGEKPIEAKECNENIICPIWHTGPWRPCDALCDEGKQRRVVTCYKRDDKGIEILQDTDCPDEKPMTEKTCLISPCEGTDWVVTEWSGCEDSCGLTLQTREATCISTGGKIYDTKYCDNSKKPELVQECTNSMPCKYSWYASQWSNCSNQCGNGTQTRYVHCLEETITGEFKKVDESNCDPNKKYDNVQECENKNKCVGNWFTGPWSDCSKPCDSGDMSRKIMCLTGENKTIDNKACDEDTYPLKSETCNQHACDPDLMPSTPDTRIATEEEEECDGDYEYPDFDLSTIIIPSTMKPEDDDGSSSEESSTKRITMDNITGSEEMVASTESSSDEVTNKIASSESDSSDSSSSSSSSDSKSSEEMTTEDSETTTNMADITTEKILETTTTTESSAEGPTNRRKRDVDSNDYVSATSFDKSTTTGDDYDTEITMDKNGTTPDSEDYDREIPPKPVDEVKEKVTTMINELLTTMEEGSGSSIDDTTMNKMETSSMMTTMEEGSGVSEQDTDITSETDTTIILDNEDMLTTTGSDDEISTSSPETSTVMEDVFGLSTANPLDEMNKLEHTIKKCRKKTKVLDCKLTKFGCCNDGIAAAKGPFKQGCEHPKTCKETKYGCCPDGISVKPNKSGKTCPIIDCKETLFGCCPDNVRSAQGNNGEGCAPPPPCNTTQYGCCPDGETTAEDNEKSNCILCSESDFGCCPDNYTFAKDSKLGGCKIEKEKEDDVTEKLPARKCENSIHGCCPGEQDKDASGPNNEGCKEVEPSEPEGPCSLSKFGCCDDKITPAHGRYKQGCCLSTTFGCCPDNILAAGGPDMQGCECKYTIFGCCPDNISYARGPNGEGCNCETNEFGCCPDKFTSAKGANFEGCPCDTYQFGCCDDGVTIAKGPEQQGCSCAESEFGCCPDEKTAATGPNKEGCNCLSSKYGCCPDGVTEALGDKFENCTEMPLSGLQCGLPKDGGVLCDTFTNYTVKWYYDTQYGGCSRFWYRGCGGNENKFESMEECKHACVSPTGRDACYLPKSKGGCDGYHARWYYDSERDQCGQFVFGGCLGNNNRFETRRECEELCVISADRVDSCAQPKLEGPCRGNFDRWHFNKETSECIPFKYGGCKGNNNNFQSIQACTQRCIKTQKGKKPELCSLSKDSGPCRAYHKRWHYDDADDMCKTFVYGGCHGNANRFETRDDCESICHAKNQMEDSCMKAPSIKGECSEKYARWSFNSTGNACEPFYYTGCNGNKNNFESLDECEKECPPHRQIDRCILPPVRGECTNYASRWYFDVQNKDCRHFYYGGCGGNENNFESESECQSSCILRSTTPAVTLSTRPPEIRPHHRAEYCYQASDAGPCSDYTVQWYYDSNEGLCKQFQYGGCQGNGNRYETRTECENNCGHLQDECTVTRVIRRCEANYTEFYYDQNSDSCYQIGSYECLYNKNRFRDQASCEERCKKHKTVATPPTTPVEDEVCNSRPDAGNCEETIEKWFFHSRAGKCHKFIYTGCGGNYNNFDSEESCERRCGRHRGEEVCLLDQIAGSCQEEIVKWSFDKNTRECIEFSYSGCDGNGNRFTSEAECRHICGRYISAPSTGTLPPQCRYPVTSGNCNDSVKRYYYNQDERDCISFIYTGCGGNSNNFYDLESCRHHCNLVAYEPEPSCDIPRTECQVLREVCPYGIVATVDNNNCEKCECNEPCKDLSCPAGTRCVVEQKLVHGEVLFRPICRLTFKGGECPIMDERARGRDCNPECTDDADCVAEKKCCNNGCASKCVSVTSIQPPPSPPEGYKAPTVSVPEPEISVEEGGFATLRCSAMGYPVPSISWRKDNVRIDGSLGRHRLLLDNSLQIFGVTKRADAGIYTCTADNGIGTPAVREIRLDVLDPRDRAAEVFGEESNVVTLIGSPAVLYCYVIGYPRPSVVWFRGEDILPLSNEKYESRRDYALLIRTVSLKDLGFYTCQAYNGLGKATAWTLTLKARGPVHTKDPEEYPFLKFIISPDSSNITIPTTPTTTPIPIITRLPLPGIVPVIANLTSIRSSHTIGEPIELICHVDGYPAPVVQWYKDNQIINDNDRTRLVEGHRFHIREAQPSDSGRYKCEAFNQYNSSSSELEVSVRGTGLHPNCTDNVLFAKCKLIVEGKFCTHKYYAVFCCKSCTEAGQLPINGPHLYTYPENTNNRIRNRRFLHHFIEGRRLIN